MAFHWEDDRELSTSKREPGGSEDLMSASSEAEHVVALPPTYVAGFHDETAVRQMPYRSPHCPLRALYRAVLCGALNCVWCRELAGTGMAVSALGFGASALAVRPAGTIHASCPSLLFRRAPAAIVPRVWMPIRITYFAQGVFHDVTQDECIQVVHQTLKAGHIYIYIYIIIIIIIIICNIDTVVCFQT